MRDLGYNPVPSVDENYQLRTSPNPDPCAPVTTTSSKKGTAVQGGDGLDIATREVILDPVGRVE